MLAIFFPHMYEDIEYLLPPEGLVGHGSVGTVDAVAVGAQARPARRVVQENAVAGPSGLR